MPMPFLLGLTLTKIFRVTISTGDSYKNASEYIVNSGTMVHERYSFPNLHGSFSADRVLALVLILPSRRNLLG